MLIINNLINAVEIEEDKLEKTQLRKVAEANESCFSLLYEQCHIRYNCLETQYFDVSYRCMVCQHMLHYYSCIYDTEFNRSLLCALFFLPVWRFPKAHYLQSFIQLQSYNGNSNNNNCTIHPSVNFFDTQINTLITKLIYNYWFFQNTLIGANYEIIVEKSIFVKAIWRLGNEYKTVIN